MISKYLCHLLSLFFFIVVVVLAAPTALAQQLESDNFTISNDELMVSSLEGQSSNFNLIGENSPLVGSLESDNFSQEGVVLGENISTPTPTPISTPTPTSTSDGSSSTSTSTSTTTTSPTPTPGSIARVFQGFFGGEEEELLSQLFDISLEIDDNTISDIKELVARVIFTSFGTESTPVDMTFIILNATGEELHRTFANTVVETEAVHTQSFQDVTVDLPDGKYTLVLKTLYNVDVEDEFRAEFTIGKEAGFNWKLYLPILGIVVFLIFLFLLWKRRKDKRKKNLSKTIGFTFFVLILICFSRPIIIFGKNGILQPFESYFQQIDLLEKGVQPGQLFDISLELDSDFISEIKGLTARVVFINFGTKSTPVNITFTILNDAGEEVYRSQDSTVVQTELVFPKYFSDVETAFPDGKYTLVLKTLYNVDVEDEFRAEFTIEKKIGLNWKLYLFILSIILILLFLLWKRRKDKEQTQFVLK